MSLPQPFDARQRGRRDILPMLGWFMNEARVRNPKTTSSLLSLMLVLSTILVGLTPTVQAVGPNQNDLNSGGDLPDNTSVNITNYIFSGSYTGSGELDYGDDNDYLRVALNANQGLSATLSFPSSTTFSNGTTVTNDFDLIFYDANLTMMGSSWMSNPESLSTNTSTVAHGGMVYIDILRYSGVGTWNLTLSKFTVSNGSGGGGSGTGGGGGSSVTNCTGNNTVQPDILEPNDSTMLWDRLGMSVVIGSCISLLIHDMSDRNLAGMIHLPIVVTSVISVLWWPVFDDLRFYFIVKHHPFILFPILLFYGNHIYDKISGYYWGLSMFILATLFEFTDLQIFEITGFISGHTLKHIFAGVGLWLLMAMIRDRKLLIFEEE